MVEKQDSVTYVDGLGKEHDALVTAVNQRGDFCPVCQSSRRDEQKIVGGMPCSNAFHTSTAPSEPYVTLVYVDMNRTESDNLVKIYDAKHISMLERETSPGLPTFHVNCWKHFDEGHTALPSDHPAFDHPFKQPDKNQEGQVIPTGRPTFAAAVNDHQNAMLASAAGAEAPKSELPDPGADKELVVETKQYSDGSSATGVAPLPNMSPAKQDALNRVIASGPVDDSLINVNGAPLPSAADLDAVAADKKAAADTSKSDTVTGSDGNQYPPDAKNIPG